MNESVLAMIDKLHARLNDLEADVKNAPIELTGFDAKLDKIDDQVYLLEVEIEKKLKNSVPLKSDSNPEDSTTDPEEAKSAPSGESILSDSAKDNIATATKSLNSLYKEGKQLFDDVSEPFADLKNIFKK